MAVLLCLGQEGLAQEIDTSPRPLANPRLNPAVVVAGVTAAPEAPAAAEVAAQPEGTVVSSLRPVPRPPELAERIAALKAASNAPGLDLSVEPEGEGIDLAAIPPPSRKEERKKKRETASRKGSVCGVAAIKGEEISRIKSKVQGCGVEDPVAITSVAGVRLSQTATVDCSIAKALNSWVDEVAQPAFDGRLVELQIAAHYICRSRNNVRGAKISEHGKGRAIDISAFILSNGTVLTVKENYNKLLRRIYKAGCSYFRTTLGPGSDGYHEDHFHFDTSARSGGAYCR
ncbi:MAG: extensin family protein [Tabrizicola sp.]|nr:extensin family protein [Tabrizicola sp.]